MCFKFRFKFLTYALMGTGGLRLVVSESHPVSILVHTVHIHNTSIQGKSMNLRTTFVKTSQSRALKLSWDQFDLNPQLKMLVQWRLLSRRSSPTRLWEPPPPRPPREIIQSPCSSSLATQPGWFGKKRSAQESFVKHMISFETHWGSGAWTFLGGVAKAENKSVFYSPQWIVSTAITLMGGQFQFLRTTVPG